MARKTAARDFEGRLRELEELVRRLEDGSLPLAESLALFERGLTLARDLQKSLAEASLRVTRLLEGETPAEAPLETAPGDSPPDDPHP